MCWFTATTSHQLRFRPQQAADFSYTATYFHQQLVRTKNRARRMVETGQMTCLQQNAPVAPDGYDGFIRI